LTGTHDVFIRFNGTEGVANIDKFQFGTPRPVSDTNLIIDGGFEGSSLSGWQSWNGSTLSITSDRVYTGSQSLLATDRPNSAQYAVYNLTAMVQPGTAYSVSAQALHTGPTSDTLRLAAKVECASPPEGHNTYPWLHNVDAVVPNTWTELSGTLIIPDCDIVDVAIFFEGSTAGTDVYLDAVSVLAN
jgi:endo-1,4-beta-xylanase